MNKRIGNVSFPRENNGNAFDVELERPYSEQTGEMIDEEVLIVLRLGANPAGTELRTG